MRVSSDRCGAGRRSVATVGCAARVRILRASGASERPAQHPQWRPENADPNRGGVSRARWRTLSRQADCRRAVRGVGRPVSRRARQAARRRKIPARRRGVARSAARLLSTTIAGSAASGSMRSASGGTRSRPGPIISKAGATRSKRSWRQARASISNWSRGGRSSRPRWRRRAAAMRRVSEQMLRDFEAARQRRPRRTAALVRSSRR